MKISFCFVPSILKEFHKKKTNTTGVLPIWQDQPKQIMGNYEEALHIILKKVNKRRGIFQRQSVRKVARLKSLSSGRTYTSRYRGVHQTFPTRRWEAQFRKGGKPTSLGCFDREDEAARAYDRMMLWSEIHRHNLQTIKCTSAQKPTCCNSLNFDISQYDEDLETLKQISQEELLNELRKQGRIQTTNGSFK